jgi:aminobenzoyl-glutamate transport protein
MATAPPAADSAIANPRLQRALDWVERTGNRLPDPAVLFLLCMLLVWVGSALLSGVSWSAIDPRTQEPIVVRNLLAGSSLTAFMAQMVHTFVSFHPLGVVLVAMLGIGVAEHTGLINAGLRALLGVTSRGLLTPMLIAVGILSHTAVDAGYVMVVPLGAVIFHAAGRHPLAGIAAAFCGVSGGFSCTFIVSSLDPLLQGISQQAAQILDPGVSLNPLNNFYFTTSSSFLVIAIGWFLTDRVIEPRVSRLAIDGDLSQAPTMDALSAPERRALRRALLTMLAGLVLLAATAWPAGSPWRAPDGQLAAANSPIIQSIVPLIFILFIVPGIVYGYACGSVKTHRDVVQGMTRSMHSMAYYIVMAFFAAQFIAAMGNSNLGALLALNGAVWLQASGLPLQIVLIGVVLITAFVNLLVGSASAKWALLAPILVPMLMALGISPDLTQAIYRVGDSSTNIITPLMPYFPLVVVFCQRYVSSSGIGTVVATMLPYSVSLLVLWTTYLLVYWGLGIPLGVGSSYEYVAPQR